MDVVARFEFPEGWSVVLTKRDNISNNLYFRALYMGDNSYMPEERPRAIVAWVRSHEKELRAYRDAMEALLGYESN